MSAPKDDFEAVRAVVEAVKDFKPEEQQRIFRWAAEKLGLTVVPTPPSYAPAAPAQSVGGPLAASPAQPAVATGIITDIKTFMAEKKPRNDVQFAAAVAYFYRFESAQAERKDFIDKDDLQEATRKAGRGRFSNPLNTLNNAHKMGLLDKGTEKGTFTINSVGENLIAMTLPDGKPTAKTGKKKPAKKKAATKKAAKKVAKA